jgi:FtsH-binding integral membrane protein
VFETGAPFLIGLATAWLVTRAWRRPTNLRIALIVWPVTVLVGMIVRRSVFDRGTATAFVIVATLFLGAGLMGWRAGWRLTERRRQASGGSLSPR